MGWNRAQQLDSDSDKTAFLRSLGLPEEVAAKLTSWINETGGVLNMKKEMCDPAAANLMNNIHVGACFKLPGDPSFLASLAGGGQGC